MLASPHRRIAPTAQAALELLATSPGWTFEPKLDGIRAVLTVGGGAVAVAGRTNPSITARYPELVAALAGSGVDAVLDGEIIVVRGGAPDFAAAHLRDAQEPTTSAGRARVAALALAHPVTFAAFDVLARDGIDLTPLPLHARREHLAGVLADLAPAVAAGRVMAVPAAGDGRALWTAVRTLGWEGLIAKRLASPYVHRRSPEWIKLKAVRHLDALVAGVEPGTGARASTFGALHLALLDASGALVAVGRVGSGFSDADLAAVSARLGELTRGGRPLVVAVEYLHVSPAGQLRFPVFRAISNADPLTCTTDQLESP